MPETNLDLPPQFAADRSPGEHRAKCPSCDSHDKDLTYRYDDDASGGTWHCHRCGDAGNWRERVNGANFPPLARRVEDPPPPDFGARWGAARAADTAHRYLVRKKVAAYSARQEGDNLLLPMFRDRHVVGLQTISPDGFKLYAKGSRKTGACMTIGDPRSEGVVFVAEGFATGATVYAATLRPVVVAFDAGNLMAVAQLVREKLPSRRLIIAGDDDWRSEGNPGVTKAREAAAAVGALVVVPQFDEARGEKDTDWNDLLIASGQDEVRRQLLGVMNLPPPEPASVTPRLIWAEDVDPMLDCDYLVKGILDRYSLALVYGATSCGKTFFALDLMLRIASGMKWRGRKTKRALVVYVAAEAGISLQRRVWAWLKEQDRLDSGLPFVIITRSVPLIEDKGAVTKFVAEILALPNPENLPLAVVIDTVSRSMHGGDENKDLPELVSSCDRLRDEAGATVLLVHHTGKDASAGPRGHSSLPAAVDVSLSIQLEPHRAAVIGKARDAQTGTSFAFELKVVNVGDDDEGDPVGTCIVEHGDDGVYEAPARGARPPRALPDLAQIAFDVLPNAIGEHGEHREGRRGVVLKLWQEHFDRTQDYDELPATSEPGDRRRKETERRRSIFGRAVQVLRGRHLIEINDRFVFRI
jgi:phage/plasmid primase-like uncharacterized protein/KaiC/GvpD/RAD55 family RecA-like ATPase